MKRLISMFALLALAACSGGGSSGGGNKDNGGDDGFRLVTQSERDEMESYMGTGRCSEGTKITKPIGEEKAPGDGTYRLVSVQGFSGMKIPGGLAELQYQATRGAGTSFFDRVVCHRTSIGESLKADATLPIDLEISGDTGTTRGTIKVAASSKEGFSSSTYETDSRTTTSNVHTDIEAQKKANFDKNNFGAGYTYTENDKTYFKIVFKNWKKSKNDGELFLSFVGIYEKQ